MLRMFAISIRADCLKRKNARDFIPFLARRASFKRATWRLDFLESFSSLRFRSAPAIDVASLESSRARFLNGSTRRESRAGTSSLTSASSCREIQENSGAGASHGDDAQSVPPSCLLCSRKAMESRGWRDLYLASLHIIRSLSKSPRDFTNGTTRERRRALLS